MFVFICVCVYICAEKNIQKNIKGVITDSKGNSYFSYFFIPLCIVRTALQEDESEAL